MVNFLLHENNALPLYFNNSVEGSSLFNLTYNDSLIIVRCAPVSNKYETRVLLKIAFPTISVGKLSFTLFTSDELFGRFSPVSKKSVCLPDLISIDNEFHTCVYLFENCFDTYYSNYYCLWVVPSFRNAQF